MSDIALFDGDMADAASRRSPVNAQWDGSWAWHQNEEPKKELLDPHGSRLSMEHGDWVSDGVNMIVPTVYLTTFGDWKGVTHCSHERKVVAIAWRVALRYEVGYGSIFSA